MTEIQFRTAYQLGAEVFTPGQVADVPEPRASQLIAERRAVKASAQHDDDGKASGKSTSKRRRSKASEAPDDDSDGDDSAGDSADDAFLNPDVNVVGNADKLPRDGRR